MTTIEVGSHPTAQAAHLWLADDVFACSTRDGVVFLDAKTNKYHGLDFANAQALAEVVAGWPMRSAQGAVRGIEESPGAAAVADGLESSGLLARRPPSHNYSCVSRLDRSQNMVAIGFGTEYLYSVGPKDVGNFIAAYLKAQRQLRFASFDSVVRSVALRKSRRGRESAFDVQEAVRRVSIFRRIRRYVFSASNRCLLHALTLTHFLALYHLFPTWVIGVSTSPWEAHSWVEHERYSLDATPERIHSYTPILAV